MLAYPDPQSAQDPDRDSLMYSLGPCADFFKAMLVLHDCSVAVRNSQKAKRFNLNISTLQNLCLPPSCHHDVADYRAPVVGGATNGLSPLNDRQDIELCEEQRAVIAGLKRPLELIHGPPGKRL